MHSFSGFDTTARNHGVRHIVFKDEVGSRGAVTRHVRRKRPLGVAASVLLPRGRGECCREGNWYCEVEGNVGVR